MRNARNALHANIARLRRLLASTTDVSGDDLVRTTGGGYVLDVPQESVDVQRFESLAREGASLIKRDPHRAIELLREALALWRGPAMADAGDGARCQTAAAYLHEQRLTTEEDLMSARLAIGEEWLATSELAQLVAEHPGRERLSEYLMLALYRSGRQSDAISVFQSTCNWLSSELGLQPGRALQELYQAILVHNPNLEL
jgi:DNA-binding SARP family transcriptional activator